MIAHKTIVVLGMHRSTTSLMAKGLHECGVKMGDSVLGPMKSNPWGHYEDLDFVLLNDEILKAAGGSWDNPPSEQAILDQWPKFTARIEALVKANDAAVDPEYPLWGWKDPRTVLTIRLFLPHLTNPYFYFCLADPKKVGQSLAARDGTYPQAGEQLAREYNRRLLRFANERACFT